MQGRECTQSTTVGDGQLVIPKGLVVTADVWSVQYNKEIYGADADTFNPLRSVCSLRAGTF